MFFCNSIENKINLTSKFGIMNILNNDDNPAEDETGTIIFSSNCR